jgi:hypothetical protein
LGYDLAFSALFLSLLFGFAGCLFTFNANFLPQILDCVWVLSEKPFEFCA